MYEVNGYIVNDGTVTDCRTGLIWLQDANCKDNLGLPGIDKSNGWLEWHDAMVAYARNRFVPSLTNAAGAAKRTANGGAFNNVGTDFYWASTAVADHTSGHQPRFS